MSNADQQWHSIMHAVLSYGEFRQDRTGIGTVALFGMAAKFDLRFGFPAVTTKKLPFKSVCGELAAFLRGAENLEEFHRYGCKWWDGNASASYWKPRLPGDVGRIYGAQWRRWLSLDRNGQPRQTDQLADLVNGLKKEPHGRRHIVTAWNPGELDQMCLPPCHIGFQCYASEDRNGGRWLDLAVHLRSLDLFIGAPCDIATYALLLHLIAREVDRQPRRLIMSVGDAHIYLNHKDQVRLVLSRVWARRAPVLRLAPEATLWNFEPAHAELENYNPHDAIAAPLNV